MTPTLQAIGLSRRFGGLLAVSDVSLALNVGTVHAVIGPNGAGKSTLVNLLAGELLPSSGRIQVDGEDIAGAAVRRFVSAGIARTFQHSNLLPELPVQENVRLAAQAVRMPSRQLFRRALSDRKLPDIARECLRRVGLHDKAGSAAGLLSHGEQRLLEIAIALAAQPRVLLLDEPLAGMGAEETAPIVGLLRTLGQDHAVLLIEHDMDVVFAVADTMTVMVDGRVLESGTPAQIRASAAVRDAYLGHGV